MDERDRYDTGMQVRRAVLGDAHVDRSVANRNAFNEEFQDLITRYAWGEIWTRPGLPRHTRSLLTLADDPTLSCRDVDQLARYHLADIQARVRELRRIALELERTIASCAGGKRGQCAILGALSRRSNED